MFITHCPDTELSLAFSCKPLEEWTATDVQVRLDEHHRKRRLQQHLSSNLAGDLQTTRATGILHSHAQSTSPAGIPQSALAAKVLPSHVQSAESPPALQTNAASRMIQTEGQSLEHVISLLEWLLQREALQHSRPPRSGTGSRNRSRGPCAICGGDNHDTTSYCRRERLCFRCHAAGHQAVTCRVTPPDSPAAQPGGPNQQGN